MRHKPIQWIRHRLRLPASSPLRLLAAISPAALRADVSALVAHEIDLPDLAAFPTPIDKARFLLHTAAEVEHALLVQYLYAAYSLKAPNDPTLTEPQHQQALSRWKPLIQFIAQEEMGHLMTVQNLLLLTRQPVNFEREDFPHVEGIYPFPLHLEPLTQQTLAKYVVAESPIEPGDIQDIITLATGAVGMTPNRVGVLYALLGVVFTRLGELDHSADDPWYGMTRALANLAFLQHPGPENWHLPEPAFDPDAIGRQAKDTDWSPQTNIRVHLVADRRSALEALRDIAIQGEGPVQAEDPQGSHFGRFLSIYRGDGQFLPFPAAGRWQPTYNVPVDPQLGDNPSNPNVIANVTTRDWTQLADARYALLLGFLEQFFAMAPERRGFLPEWSRQEMRFLQQLADKLVHMPRAHDPSAVAALPFTLSDPLHLPQDDARAQWQVHIDRLIAAHTHVQRMLQSHSPGDPLLQQILQADEQHLSAAQQLQQGNYPQPEPPPRTRFQRVQRILNDATGSAAPFHGSQGRFWNKLLSDFLQTSVYGLPVIAPVGPERGKRSNLTKALKGEAPFDGSTFMRMPLGLPAVASEHIAFIEQWIDDGCPDDPLPPEPTGSGSHD